MFDIIEWRHSRSIGITISHAIPNTIDILFHVIYGLESTSEVVAIVVDKILHSLEDLRGVSEPLQGYCTMILIHCQGAVSDAERRMISNGDVRTSEVFQRG